MSSKSAIQQDCGAVWDSPTGYRRVCVLPIGHAGHHKNQVCAYPEAMWKDKLAMSDERQAAIQQEIARRVKYGPLRIACARGPKYDDCMGIHPKEPREWCNACLLRAAGAQVSRHSGLGHEVILPERSMVRRERDELKSWKESAMQSLARWHALGEALQARYPIPLGSDIPTALLAALRAGGLLGSDATGNATGQSPRRED